MASGPEKGSGLSGRADTDVWLPTAGDHNLFAGGRFVEQGGVTAERSERDRLHV
jgi:hypothetical protein